jgi:hypothetical protein
MGEVEPGDFMHGEDEEPEVDIIDELLDPDLDEPTPSDKLAAIIKHFAVRFERDTRFSCHIWRDAPNTDANNLPCKGFLGQYRSIPSETEMQDRFGGQSYRMLIKGPRRDLDSRKIEIKTLASLRGLMIAGPVRPNPDDKNYQSEAGFVRVQEARAAQKAEEGKKEQPDEQPDEKPDEKPDADQRRSPPWRDPRHPGQLHGHPVGPGGLPQAQPAHRPVATGLPTSGGDPLAAKKLEADIEERKANRERMWTVEDSAREAALSATQGNGGMDAETIKALFSEMKEGNQSAITKFSEAVSMGSKESAEAMARVLEMFQAKVSEPRDDREEQRLKELLDTANENVRSLRQEHQAELTRVETAQRDEVKELREARDKAEERVERRLKETFAQERTGWEHQREALQSEVGRLNEKLENTERRMEEKHTSTEGRLEEKLKVEEKRGDDRVESLKATHQTALDGIKRDFETRERMLSERIRDFEGKVDSARGKELELRDAKQTESMGKMKAELERDTAKADADRLDLGKVSAAMGVGKEVAGALGYEKPDPKGPSPWESIGSKAVETVGSIVTNERFTKLMGNIAGGVRDVAAARAAAEPAPPAPSPQLPAQPNPDQQSYDDLVAQKKAERKAELEAKQAERRARMNAPPATPTGRQLPPEQRPPTEEEASAAIAAALADEPLADGAPSPVGEPLPDEPEGLVEPEEEDRAGALIERLEDLAAANTPPEQGLDMFLSEFSVSRDHAKLFIEGKTATELLAMMGVTPVEVSAKARTLLDAALATLA